MMYDDLQIDMDPSKLKIIKKLKEDWFGVVMLCEYQGTQLNVKFFNENFHERSQYQKFHDEVNCLRGLYHPCILPFIGDGFIKRPQQSKEEFFIAQEYLNDSTLKQLLFKQCTHVIARVYTVEQAYGWIMDIARGVRYLHNSHPQVIHGDLRADNIYFDHTDTFAKVRIADFGLHSLVYREHPYADLSHYDLRSAAGSYVYMSPEVFAREQYSPKMDVYSFAIIMWEVFSYDLLGLRTIYSGNGKEVLTYQYDVTQGKRPAIPDTWPQQLKCLTQECWSQDPQNRPDFDSIIKRLEQMKDEIAQFHVQREDSRRRQVIKGRCTLM